MQLCLQGLHDIFVRLLSNSQRHPIIQLILIMNMKQVACLSPSTWQAANDDAGQALLC